MADKRQKWNAARDSRLLDIVESLDESRPRRGRKSHHDEMDARDWWALVARLLRRHEGIEVSGDACARRLRVIASRQEASFTIDATEALSGDTFAEIVDALETIKTHTQKIADAININTTGEES